jgi:MinD-like ATPase involved in chromosome partitioning or flagellar assembly
VIITVTSWRGVGCTTTALLLAAALAEEGATWLVEADPAGGVLAGRVHFDAHELGGLERIAFPTDRLAGVEAFEAVAHAVGGLRLVAAPAEPFRAHACHSPRLPWAPVLHELDGPVVIDAGRLRAHSPATPLLAMADTVLLVSSPEVCAAVATTEWLHAAGRVSPADETLETDHVVVSMVDQPGGVAFARAAIAAELGNAFAGWLPWEPSAVDLVHRGAELGDRRLRRSGLASAVRALRDAMRRPVEVV